MVETFPNIPPHQGTSRTTETRVLRAEFGDGYSQRLASGLNSVIEEWQVSWVNLPISESHEIDTFLRARNAVEAFHWTPPRETPEDLSGAAFLPAHANFARASEAWYFDAAGKLQKAAADVARFGYDHDTGASLGLLIEAARTQEITNSRADNSGSRPTTWDVTLPASLTLSSESYTQSADWDNAYILSAQFSNAHATEDRTATIHFEASQVAAGTSSDTLALSLWTRRVSGTLGSVTLGITQENSGGASLGDITATSASPGTTLARLAADLSPTDANTVTVRPFLNVTVAAQQSPTIEIVVPQLEKAAGATTPILTTSGTATRAADTVTFPQKLFTCAQWTRQPSLPGADTVQATFRQEFDLTI